MKATALLTVLLIVVSASLGAPPAASDANSPCAIYDGSGQKIPAALSCYYPCSSDAVLPWSNETDEISLQEISRLAGPLYYSMSGGDSDGDGLFEAYMYIKDNQGGWTFTYRGYENDGNDAYTQVFQVTDNLIPYAYGEIDGDNLPDVIGQSGTLIRVYESPTLGQYANRMVWQSPPVVNVTGYTAIGDLDEDDHWEIIHTSNSFGSDNRLILWENTGDNQYQEIYNQWASNNNLGTKAIADFDGDGLMEVAFSSGGGDVYVYESNGNNSVQQIYRGSMNTWNAYACTYADDMDGNGRPEFICGGSDSDQGWVTQIYEAAGNDSFVVRQEIVIWDGYFGVPGNCVGDFDHDGADEFVIQCAQSLRVYEWNGQSYTQVQNIPENFGSILHGVFSYDGNYNGYDEVFWLGIGDGGYWTNATILLEDEAAGFTPDISITLTPLNPPIIIPATGGRFSFTIEVANDEALPQTFDTWIMIELPNGHPYGPVLSAFDLTLPGGSSISRTRTQYIPIGAPEGQYYYTGYVGDFSTVVYDSSYFTFMKVCDRGWGSGVEEWNNLGESLVDAGVQHIETALAAATLHPEEISVLVSPNPFNPTTVARYKLRAASHVSFKVYDIAGRLVATLMEGWGEAGVHEVTFDGSNLTSAVYIYRLQAGEYPASGKMVLMK